MKTSELISRLQEQMERHGDKTVLWVIGNATNGDLIYDDVKEVNFDGVNVLIQ